MDEDRSHEGEEINFKDIKFTYTVCTDWGYFGNAWFGTDTHGYYYGPCISRKEVFDLIKIIVESRK